MNAKRAFGTAALIAVASAVFVLLICMVIYEARANTAQLLNNAWGDDALIYEGETYLVETTVKNYTKTLCILRRAGDEEN